MTNETWLLQLQENGYRLTTPRRAVVNAVAESTRALTPLEVYDAARKRCRGLGLVSVYRTLEKLEELGLIQRVHQPQGCQAFIAASHEHEHLLICSRCGSVARFSGDDLEMLFRSIAHKTGYAINDHWLQLFGLCENCR
jgi:Fur family transcriptional regulator, ferric uptake regulator